MPRDWFYFVPQSAGSWQNFKQTNKRTNKQTNKQTHKHPTRPCIVIHWFGRHYNLRFFTHFWEIQSSISYCFYSVQCGSSGNGTQRELRLRANCMLTEYESNCQLREDNSNGSLSAFLIPPSTARDPWRAAAVPRVLPQYFALGVTMGLRLYRPWNRGYISEILHVDTYIFRVRETPKLSTTQSAHCPAWFNIVFHIIT